MLALKGAWEATDRKSRVNLLLLGGFFCLLALFGGASRIDEFGQPVVRMAAIVLIFSSGLQVSRGELRSVRAPLLFVLAAAAIVLAQLVPLPGNLWVSLPGRQMYASALAKAGLPIGSRPLSLTPDLTLNSLLALLPPLATMLTVALIGRRAQALIIAMLLAMVIVSSLLAVLQISSGAPYLYRIANFDTGVGVFANRNHQALFLATAFPLLSAWIGLSLAQQHPARTALWGAFCFGALLFPLLLVTGSRAGLLLGLFAAALAAAMVFRPLRSAYGSVVARRARWLIAAPLVFGLGAVAVFAFFARDAALQRLLHASEDSDLRLRVLPIVLRMIKEFFPFGSGLGSFDSVYRSYEPAEALSTVYMNEAHNDLAQIVLEGGAPAACLVVAFVAWVVVRSWKAWRSAKPGPDRVIARTAAAMMLLILLSSVVDYPLRTPIFATVLSIVACWLAFGAEGLRGGQPAAGLAAPLTSDRAPIQSGVAAPERIGNV